jgi:hypothetical protein
MKEDEMSNAQKVYVAPSLLLAAMGAKLKVSDVLDPSQLGWAAHPMFGELPTIRVVAVTDDGRLLDGVFTCTDEECEESVLVHSGDWFQKRRCAAHQAAHNKGKRSKALDPATKEANKAKRAQERAEKAVERAKAKLTAAQEKAASQPISERADLIAAVAAEKGVEISQETQAKIAAGE